MEPGIEELRRSMPKAIAIPSHDWGVEGIYFLPRKSSDVTKRFRLSWKHERNSKHFKNFENLGYCESFKATLSPDA